MIRLIKITTFFIFILTFNKVSLAKVIELKSCKLEILEEVSKKHTKTIFLFSGLISSARTYSPLINRLKTSKLPYNFISINLPPIGSSELRQDYRWSNIQQCMKEYLADKKEYLLVLHDLSSAMILPILKELKELPKGIILLNALIRPSEYQFVFPFSIMRDSITSKVTSQVFPAFLYRREMKKIVFHNSKLIDSRTLDLVFNDTIGNNSNDYAQLIQGYPSSPALDQVIKLSLTNPKVKQLIIWGLADPIMSNQLQFLDETSSHGSRETFLIKDAKHFLMWEYAKEISSVINLWIKKNKL